MGNSGGKWRDGGIAEENDMVGVRGRMWKGIGERWGEMMELGCERKGGGNGVVGELWRETMWGNVVSVGGKAERWWGRGMVEGDDRVGEGEIWIAGDEGDSRVEVEWGNVWINTK